MSLPIIIITLTGNTISLEYFREGGAGSSAPFPRYTSPVALSAFTKSKAPDFDSDFVIDVEDRLKTLFSETLVNYGEFESLRTSLPIIFLTENDLPEDTGSKLVTLFSTHGFGNVSAHRTDVAIARYYAAAYSFQGVVSAFSDGRDLYLSVSGYPDYSAVSRNPLPGDGADPRVTDLVEKLWEKVRYNTYDLEKEDQIPILTRIAEEYLGGNSSEKEGYVRLSDGNEYPYSIRKSMVNNDGTRRIKASLDRILTEKGLADRSRNVLVMCGSAITSPYLLTTITPGFGEVAQFSGALKDAVIRHEAGLVTFNRPPQQPQPPVQKPQPTQPGWQTTRESLQTTPPGWQTPPENPITPPVDDEPALIPIELKAEVITQSAGFLKKKKVLHVEIKNEDRKKLKWHSVLIAQERILTSIIMENVVSDYQRGDQLPFSIDIPLPLKQFPNAKSIKLYFRPHPDEPVGINNAYEVETVTVKL